jgi:uncharacterized protein (TIGR02996 family)
VTFDDTPAALRAKWEADKARRASSSEPVDDALGQRDLEAALRAHPDELDTYLVYADWLADHGDEWGQLITVQHALETLPRFGAGDRRDELSRRETLLRFQLSRRLWGSLGELVYNTQTQRYYCDLIDAEWRCGFVHAARIWATDPELVVMLVRGLAVAPISIVLRRLALQTHLDPASAATLADALVPLFAHAPHLTTLEVNHTPIDLHGNVRDQLCDLAQPRYDDVDE